MDDALALSDDEVERLAFKLSCMLASCLAAEVEEEDEDEVGIDKDEGSNIPPPTSSGINSLSSCSPARSKEKSIRGPRCCVAKAKIAGSSKIPRAKFNVLNALSDTFATSSWGAPPGVRAACKEDDGLPTLPEGSRKKSWP